MPCKTIKIRVRCEGLRKQLQRQESRLKISLAHALYFGGVNLSRRYIIESPIEGFKPTDEYDIQITRHTPEVVNGERISSHDVQLVRIDQGYEFTASLTTTAMPQLSVKTQRILRQQNLLDFPNGVRGYLEAEVSAWFYGWAYEPAVVTTSWHEITIDLASSDWQPVGEYGQLASDLEQVECSVDVDTALAEWEKCQFQFQGSKLFARYTDSKQPLIEHQQPPQGLSLIDDFTPSIEAQFHDSGGAGIETASFEMTIDRSSIAQQIRVGPDSPGLVLTESGFRYRPSVELTVGLHQVQVSISDRQGNTAGSKWYFYLRYGAPAILNLQPASGTTLDTPRPIFSAEFSDRTELGLDLDSFELIIDDRLPVKKDARGMRVSAAGFSYRPPINLTAGEHHFSVAINDSAKKPIAAEGVFTVETKPINQALGDLPLGNLQGIGPTLEAQYVNSSGGLITTIKDLVNQDPQTLKDEVGVSLSQAIEHVTHADILCSRVAFNRMNFSELWDRSVWEIAHMTDEEILDLDQPLDEQGNVIVEAEGDVAEMRENIALLFICLDNSVLHGLTFGDIVSNQVEGCYYR